MVRVHQDPPNAVRGIGGGHSSAGRAPALQAGGQRFDPVCLHQDSLFKTFRRDVLNSLSSFGRRTEFFKNLEKEVKRSFSLDERLMERVVIAFEESFKFFIERESH